MVGRLTSLQVRILRVLSRLDPPWTLTGGGALAGVYLGHRATRDLDLFWRSRAELGPLGREALSALRADGLDAETLRTTPTFGEIRVADGVEVCVVDLVAEPFGPLEPPERADIAGIGLAVDSLHEILVNKLTALLSRAELRDLLDVTVILEAGGDLDRALADAPKKDGGFSALTLAWVLKDFAAARFAQALGWSEDEGRDLEAFRQRLIARLVAATAPE